MADIEKGLWSRYAEKLGLGGMTDAERMVALMANPPSKVLQGLSKEEEDKLNQTISLATTVAAGDA